MNLSGDPPSNGGFRHEAVLLYGGLGDFLARVVPYIQAARAAREPVMAVLPEPRIAALQASLDGTTGVQFHDIADVGENPARLMALWRDFVEEYGTEGRPARVVAELVWAGGDPARRDEYIIHESLIELAFSDEPPCTLWCVHDVADIDPAAVAGIDRRHGTVIDDGERRLGAAHRHPARIATLHEYPLPPVPPNAETMSIEDEPLVIVRRFIEDFAAARGVGSAWTKDLVLAVNELVTNTVLYAPGEASLAVWMDGGTDGTVNCEVRDGGTITDPLVGRLRPPRTAYGGRGLWIVNQLCNLVNIRSSDDGTIVRIQVGAR